MADQNFTKTYDVDVDGYFVPHELISIGLTPDLQPIIIITLGNGSKAILASNEIEMNGICNAIGDLLFRMKEMKNEREKPN